MGLTIELPDLIHLGAQSCLGMTILPEPDGYRPEWIEIFFVCSSSGQVRVNLKSKSQVQVGYEYCHTLSEPDLNYITNLKIWENYISTKHIKQKIQGFFHTLTSPLYLPYCSLSLSSPTTTTAPPKIATTGLATNQVVADRAFNNLDFFETKLLCQMQWL